MRMFKTGKQSNTNDFRFIRKQWENAQEVKQTNAIQKRTRAIASLSYQISRNFV